MAEKNDQLDQLEYCDGEENDDDGGALSATAVAILKRCMYVLCATLLTLSLPISLSLLARQPLVPNVLAGTSPSHLLLSVVMLTPQVLVLCLCLYAFLYLSTGFTIKPSVHQTRAVVAALQIVVFVGSYTIGGACLQSGGACSGTGGAWMTTVHSAVFFLGMYEITVYWSTAFVRRVVAGVVYGETDLDEADTTVDRTGIGVLMCGAWAKGAFRLEVERWGGGGVRWTVGLPMLVVGMARAAVTVLQMERNLSSARLFRRQSEYQETPDFRRRELSV